MENSTDKILVENGDMFEGTRDQFRDCFFDNATNDEIISWCNENDWTLKINDKIIIDRHDKIIIGYWHSKFSDLKYSHLEEFEYSKRKRNNIIDYITEKGYNVMLQQSKSSKNLYIWIDNSRFGQR